MISVGIFGIITLKCRIDFRHFNNPTQISTYGSKFYTRMEIGNYPIQMYLSFIQQKNLTIIRNPEIWPFIGVVTLDFKDLE